MSLADDANWIIIVIVIMLDGHREIRLQDYDRTASYGQFTITSKGWK